MADDSTPATPQPIPFLDALLEDHADEDPFRLGEESFEDSAFHDFAAYRICLADPIPPPGAVGPKLDEASAPSDDAGDLTYATSKLDEWFTSFADAVPGPDVEASKLAIQEIALQYWAAAKLIGEELDDRFDWAAQDFTRVQYNWFLGGWLADLVLAQKNYFQPGDELPELTGQWIYRISSP